MPLGDGLRNEIVNLLENVKVEERRDRNDMFFMMSGSGRDSVFNKAIVQTAGHNEWEEWFRKCQIMAQGLRHASSIDRYLDIHRDDEVMVKIGKMAIGRCILKAEGKSTVVLGENDQLDMGKISGEDDRKAIPQRHWLNELVLRLQENVRRENFADILSNVTFICFNYDRVIEHYLYNAIKTLGNLTEVEASKVMENLKIYHPYGRLGHLFWEKPTTPLGVHFGATLDHANGIAGIGENLRIFTETIEENDEINDIRIAIRDAGQIVFMGFSFLEQNMKLISHHQPSDAKRVFATSYGESPLNQRAAKGMIATMLQRAVGEERNGAVSVDMIDQTAGTFMADNGNYIRAGL